MAKFKIQPEPTFNAVVHVPRIGGDPMEVPFVFKYRDRDQLAELFQQWDKDADELRRKFADGSMQLTDYTAAVMQMQVEQIKDIVIGWDFDDEFNEESILALVRTSVSVPAAVITAYQEAFQRARMGN